MRCLCRWCWVEEACEVLMLLVLGGGSLRDAYVVGVGWRKLVRYTIE